MINKDSLIFFVYPDPRGSEENQFTPLGDGVNKLIRIPLPTLPGEESYNQLLKNYYRLQILI